MADELHNYRIKNNMIKKSVLVGIKEEGIETLGCIEEENRHVFISSAIDGGQEESTWGRFWFENNLSEEMILTVYAYATDHRENEKILFDCNLSIKEKRDFFLEQGAIKAVNQSDILLLGMKGRFLYVMIDAMGSGKGNISKIRVNNRADICMEVLPEIYQEENGFFHRYLSIFSSMYLNFQEEIQGVYRLLDLESAPVELLPTLAHWMGVDVSGEFLEEQRMRTLVNEAYSLNKMKGTRAALERLTEIVLGEKAIILEKNVFRDNAQTNDEQIYKKLYGERPYDVTLLIKTYVPEGQKSQLMFLLNQFKPIRCRLLIHFLDGRDELDSHAYMDMNARISETEMGILDERMSLDGMILLEE